eukprot:4879616-Amphidinium_carterae.4
MQHSKDVAKSFNLFDPENQPSHSAEGTHHSTSEAAQPLTVPAPQEPSPWMAKHVGFIYNRLQIGQDGQSPYSKNQGQKYKSPIIAFGETVLCSYVSTTFMRIRSCLIA